MDFKQEGYLTDIDLFDHIHHQKSKFGLWLFNAVAVDAERMTFAQYVSVIASAAIMKKNEMLRLIFDSSGTDSLSLTKGDWNSLVEIMLSAEKVHHPRRKAIGAFDKFTSPNVHGERVLHFEDFVKITGQYPFVTMPFVRLISSIREKHLGETFWRLKKEEIQCAYTAM